MGGLFFNLFIAISLLSAAHAEQAITNPSHQLQQTLYQTALQAAQEQKLSKSKTWLKLIHYKKAILGGYKSEIITDGFFLSKDGKHKPDEELKETLKQIYQSKETDDKSIQCRFPARYYFLTKNLKLTNLPANNCKLFNTWVDLKRVKSLSLLFANGYFSNPASYYGHILLKFNTNHQNPLLEQSINYGAVLGQDNGLVYVIKGLVGGYRAGFSYGDFYHHNQNYSENELRDLWDYKLNLTDEDKNFIIYHIWELIDHKFTYYFLKQNCGYRIGDLLELVINEPIINSKKPYSVPINVFHNINKDKHIKTIERIPSRLSSFKERFLDLSIIEKTTLKEMLKKDITINQTKKYSELTTQNQVHVLDTLIDYYAFLIIKNKGDQKYKQKSNSILAQRLQVDFISKNKPPKNMTPIHLSEQPSRLKLSFIDKEHSKNALGIEFRPAYYDLLSSIDGRAENASTLKMLNFRFEALTDKFYLSGADLLQIEALKTSATGLEGDGGLSWALHIGADQASNGCSNCIDLFLKTGIGKAFSLNKGIFYGLIKAKAQTKKHKTHSYTGLLNIGVASQISKLQFLLDTEYLQPLDGDQKKPYLNYRLGVNKKLSKKVSLEAIYYGSDLKNYKYELGIGYYW